MVRRPNRVGSEFEGDDMSWLVVATKPQQESRAETNLRRQFMNVYCPRIYSRACMKPLFPSYLFVLLEEPSQIRTIPNTYGVRGIIKFGDEPATVSEEQITAIKSRERNGIFYPFKQGDSVSWKMGLVGIFDSMVDDDDSRCKVLFSMLGKGIHKVLRLNDIKPAIVA